MTGGSPGHLQRDEPSGEVPLLPIQHWFFEQGFENKHHWNQSVLLDVPAGIDLARLEAALAAVVDHHAALRLRYRHTEQGWVQFFGAATSARVERIPLGGEAEPIARLEREANRIQRSLDLERGPLGRFALFEWASERRLLVVMHHLISDTVSWRILFDDWREAYTALGRGEAVLLPVDQTSYQAWSQHLREHAGSAAIANELPYWHGVLGGERRSLPARDPNGDNRVRSTRTVSVTLRETETAVLLHRAPRFFGTLVNDLLLSALTLALCRWSGQPSLLVELEGHGREHLFDSVDLSRTVGWFTSPQMVRLQPVLGDLPASIRAIRAQLRRAPHHGLGYGITRYLTEPGKAMDALPFPQVFFNYLGQFDQLFDDPDWLVPAQEPRGDERCPDSCEDAWFGGGGVVHQGRLRLDFRYSVAIHDESTARALVEHMAELLREMARLCTPGVLAALHDVSPGAE
jgi:non-ribosomal peptide synthase protein (TIGR01720 family)